MIRLRLPLSAAWKWKNHSGGHGADHPERGDRQHHPDSSPGPFHRPHLFRLFRNELDLEAGDFLEYFLPIPGLGQSLSAGGFEGSRKFSRMAAKARKGGKPVLVLRWGVPKKADWPFLSHRSDSAAIPFMKPCSAERHHPVRRSMNCSNGESFRSLRESKGKPGGDPLHFRGGGALLADFAADHRIDLPLPSNRTRNRLKDWTPAVSAITNPWILPRSS